MERERERRPVRRPRACARASWGAGPVRIPPEATGHGMARPVHAATVHARTQEAVEAPDSCFISDRPWYGPPLPFTPRP